MEILAWFVVNVIGRINTKTRLYGLGILQNNQVICGLCDMFEESYGHLFFQCEFAWFLWCHWLKEWNVSWMSPLELKCFFESWMGILIRGQRKKVWWRAFFVNIWTIWRCRNKCVFEGKITSKEEAKELVMFWHKQWSENG